MSPSRDRLSFLSLVALTVAFVAAPAQARALRNDGPQPIRERVAATIVRLLPQQPKPARRFAPVPAGADQQLVAVWLDRELVWIGEPGQVQGAFETAPFDRLQTEPSLPPWEPRPIDEHEICVGFALRVDPDAHLEENAFEIDCDLFAPQ